MPRSLGCYVNFPFPQPSRIKYSWNHLTPPLIHRSENLLTLQTIEHLNLGIDLLPPENDESP